MNTIEKFFNKMFGEIRAINVNGKPYFVALDIARALGYVNPGKAVRTHCKGGSEMDLPSKGGVQSTKIIPEGDVYRLIFKSKLPAADEFETWLADTILPSIRKNGGYIDGQENLSQEDYEQIMSELKALTSKIKVLEEKNAALQKRRHELIAEKKAVQEKYSGSRREISALNEYADIFENLYFDLLKECDGLRRKVKALAPKKAAPAIAPAKTIKVDSQGFLI